MYKCDALVGGNVPRLGVLGPLLGRNGSEAGVSDAGWNRHPE